jgi:hypothetical protein
MYPWARLASEQSHSLIHLFVTTFIAKYDAARRDTTNYEIFFMTSLICKRSIFELSVLLELSKLILLATAFNRVNAASASSRWHSVVSCHSKWHWATVAVCVPKICVSCPECHLNIKTNKARGLSPRANYTDRATAAYQRSKCRRLRIEGCRVVSAAVPLCRNLDFLDRSRYFFFLVAPQMYSWVDPVPDPLLLRKSVSAKYRTWTSESVARNTDH